MASAAGVPPRIQIDWLFLPHGADRDASLDAAARLACEIDAGLDFDEARREHGAPPPSALPVEPLTRTQLWRSLGSGMGDLAISLEPGETSRPFEVAEGFLLLHRRVMPISASR